MGLINVPAIENNDEATPELWNARFGTIVDLLNGNVDADNLAAGAVTAAKIGASAVTTVKINDASVTNAKLATATGEVGAIWNSWSPTWTNAVIGNGVLTTGFTQIGKTIHFRLALKLGSSTNFSGAVSFTLPVPAHAYYGDADNYRSLIGGAELEDNGVSNYVGFTIILGSTTNAFPAFISANGGTFHGFQQLSNSSPVGLGSGDLLTCMGTYEAA